MRHYVWSLVILLGLSTVTLAEDRYCLYWPVYIDGANALYVADWIDTSDPNPCGNAEFVYYWADVDDPLVPEDCPDCRTSVYSRSGQFSSTGKLKPLNHFAGLQTKISSDQEFADLIPLSWQRFDAKAGGNVSWAPREGISCQNSRVITVKTESGNKVQVKLFDVKFSPDKAHLPHGLVKPKTLKLGFEVAGTPQSASSSYEPKKMPRHLSANQGLIRVDGAKYQIISKTPLFRD